MSDQERAIKDLEERVAKLEKQPAGGSWKFIKIALSVILGIFILLTLIGVMQFVSAG